MQPVLDEHFVSWAQSPKQMDKHWEMGLRHFGPVFFRYREAFVEGRIRHVLPLRIDVEKFAPSKSQRRVLRKCASLEIRTKTAVLDAERHRLFKLHIGRFKENVPKSLEDFLGPSPEVGPCETLEIGGYLKGRLVVAGYLDIGQQSVSSVYALFDPEFSYFSLGTASLLWELDLARRMGKKWHYPGYCYHESSSYDYKLNFRPLEAYDWKRWRPWTKSTDERATEWL